MNTPISSLDIKRWIGSITASGVIASLLVFAGVVAAVIILWGGLTYYRYWSGSETGVAEGEGRFRELLVPDMLSLRELLASRNSRFGEVERITRFAPIFR